nr:MAG: DNA pilot protein [Microvirus sp.]QJB19653.1 MAG: DNA pilot protein [Microvirus sp.]
MDPLTVGLIVGGVGLVGNALGNDANRANARDANAASQSNAREQMAFQERMSNSAYQRAMGDMKQAGLNPMLAYSQGGASAPSGAAGNVTTPNYQDPLGPAVASGFDASQKSQITKNANDQLKLNQTAQASQALVQTAQAEQLAQSAKTEATRRALIVNQIPKSKLDADFYSSETGAAAYKVNKFSDTVGGILNNINSGKSIFKRDSKVPKRMQEKLNTDTGELELYGY